MTETKLTSGFLFEDVAFEAEDYRSFVLPIPEGMDTSYEEKTAKDVGGNVVPVVIYKPEFVKYAWETFGDRYKSIPKGEKFEVYPGLFIDYIGMSSNSASKIVKGTRSSASTLAYRRNTEIRRAEEALRGDSLIPSKAKYEVRDYVSAMRSSIPPAVYAVDLRQMYDAAVEQGDWKAMLSIGKAMGLHFRAIDQKQIDAPDEVVSLEAMIRRKNAELKQMKLDKKIADSAKTIDLSHVQYEIDAYDGTVDEIYDQEEEYEE